MDEDAKAKKAKERRLRRELKKQESKSSIIKDSGGSSLSFLISPPTTDDEWSYPSSPVSAKKKEKRKKSGVLDEAGVARLKNSDSTEGFFEEERKVEKEKKRERRKSHKGGEGAISEEGSSADGLLKEAEEKEREKRRAERRERRKKQKETEKKEKKHKSKKKGAEEKAEQVEAAFEVIIPIEDEATGEIDYEELYENVHDIATDPILGENQNCNMTFYFRGLPLIVAEKFSDLKGSNVLELMKREVFWLDVYGFTQDTLRTLSRVFGFHSLSVEDILAEEAQEKCEHLDDYIFISIQILLGVDSVNLSILDSESVFIVSCEKYILTLHTTKLTAISKIHQRLEKIKNLTLTAGWVLYLILDNIIDSYVPAVRKYEFETKTIDELVLSVNESEKTDMLVRIRKARKDVSVLTGLLLHKIDIFTALQTRDKLFEKLLVSKEAFLYIEDVGSHVSAMSDRLKNFGEILNESHSTYLAHIDIKLTQASNEIGVVVKKLTGGACIFGPLALITSVQGMNVRIPGEIGSTISSNMWFWLIVIGLYALGIIAYLIGRYKKWM